MIYLIHIANLLYLAGYIVRDILSLRILAFLGGVFAVIYFSVLTVPLYEAAIWNAVYASVNLLQGSLLIRERMPFGMSQEEILIFKKYFTNLTPGQFRKILKYAQWCNASKDDKLFSFNQEGHSILFLTDGELRISLKEKFIIKLESGHFVGEQAFLTKEKNSSDVYCDTSVRFLSWKTAEFDAVLEKDLSLKQKWLMNIGFDIANKMRITNVNTNS